MRRILAITVGRSDFGIYRPVLHALRQMPHVDVSLIAAGAHTTPAGSAAAAEIAATGIAVAEQVDMLLAGDAPAAVAKGMGVGVLGFAQAYQRLQPDLLLTLGDRFEMLAAVVASLPFNLPVAHVHGGEITIGAIDDAMRHAITKLAHVHFVAAAEHARRVLQLGEEPWRIEIVGAPALDAVIGGACTPEGELRTRFELAPHAAPIVATFHPETRASAESAALCVEFLAALQQVASAQHPVICTGPNADFGSEGIRSLLMQWCREQGHARFVEHLGTEAYFGLLRMASVMAGNSSSGIIEAPSFGLPVVNVGARQQGRTRARNVIDVPHERGAIAAALRRALSLDRRTELADLVNPYGDGRAAPRIAARLADMPLNNALLAKRFFDLPADVLEAAEARFARAPWE